MRDFNEIETRRRSGTTARDRDRRAAHRGHRHRGLLPAGRGPHREGRHLHQHAAAAPVAPQGGRAAGRLPLGAVVRLPPGAPDPRASSPARASPRDRAAARPDLGLPAARARTSEPERRGGAAGDQRPARRRAVRRPLQGAARRRLDGVRVLDLRRHLRRTASTRPRAAGPAREQNWIAPEWGWAWPANRRILYNRASADPTGKPWSERKRYVWWDDGAARWTRLGDDARLPGSTSRPTTCRPTTPAGSDALRGDDAVHHAGRRPRLAVRARAGWSTGRCPPTTSRTSRRSATRSTASSANPTRQALRAPENPYNPTAARPVRTSSRTC